MPSLTGVQTCALRSEEHTSELQSLTNIVCRLLLEKKMDTKTFSPVRHYLVVDKKWTIKDKKLGFSFAVGFVWQGAEKYTGSFFFKEYGDHRDLPLSPTRRFSD